MPTEFDKWRDQKIIEIADEVAEIREKSAYRALQIGAGSKTAAVLENGNAIASAGNSTLELPASERSDCDCCGKRPYKYTGVFYGIETAYCWECAGETAEEQDE